MKLVFQFADFQSFMWMDGHGPYVWASYGITFAVMTGLVWTTAAQRKAFFKRQAALYRRADNANP